MNRDTRTLLNEIMSLSDFERTKLFMNYIQESIKDKTAIDLIKVYEKKLRYFQGSEIPLEHTIDCMHIFGSCITNKLYHYDYIELSPIVPLGINSIITKLSQSIVGSTIRSSEVIADPTTMLLLEASYRRKQLKKKGLSEGVDLSTCCRVLRMQKYKDEKFLQHFNTFALASIKYTKLPMLDKIKKLKEHVIIYIDYMLKHNKKKYSFCDIEVNFSSIQVLDQLISHMSPSQIDNFRRNTLNDTYNYLSDLGIEEIPTICSVDDLCYLDNISQIYDIKELKGIFFIIYKYLITPLSKNYPNIKFGLDLNRKTGHGYYKDICFSLSAKNSKGITYMLGDGGEVSWASQFLSDNNESAIVSGFGLEMSQLHFLDSCKQPTIRKDVEFVI